ncbi:MAG: hypothetical protein LBI27_02660, partial [Clostridiales bacterium]|nr:hypothetical protein [Clostridiales bacterium]
IENKAIIKEICDEQEEIQMAVTTLARQSEDKYTRQAYQRRQDDIYFYNKRMNEWEEDKRMLAEKDAIIAELRLQLHEKQTN